MYAAHFAAGMVLKSRAPETPTWALLTGAFVPDVIWIFLARTGIEPTEPARFFDDWSHSLAMIALWATVFAACFWTRQRAVKVALWLGVFSHFALDAVVHPKLVALFPHSGIHLGVWTTAQIGARNYWLIQLAVVVALLVAYVLGRRQLSIPANIVAASCVLIIFLHLLMYPG